MAHTIDPITVGDWLTPAEHEIDLVEQAAAAWGDAKAVAMQLEDNRARMKLDAIRRIMEAGPHPISGKPHSVSSAEPYVETDAEYAALRADQREAVILEKKAEGFYQAQRLRADLAKTIAAAKLARGL